MGFPKPDEAAPHYFSYINRISGDNIAKVLESQLRDVASLLSGVSEEKSLHRYAPEKWSIRQVLSHLNDTERAFAFRALWFARDFHDPLPSFDQNISVNTARADEYSWASHLGEFRDVRRASVALFRKLPSEAWVRGGVASG